MSVVVLVVFICHGQLHDEGCRARQCKTALRGPRRWQLEVLRGDFAERVSLCWCDEEFRFIVHGDGVGFGSATRTSTPPGLRWDSGGFTRRGSASLPEFEPEAGIYGGDGLAKHEVEGV